MSILISCFTSSKVQHFVGRTRLRDLALLLFVSVLSILAGLFLLEGVVRVALPEPVRGLYDVMPEKKISFVPASRARYQTREFDVTFEINRFGRRDKEWSPEMIQDPSGVLFIGDSMVLGYGLKDEESLPTLLEGLFQERGEAREVFNFGMGGAVSTPEYRALLEEALRIGIEARTLLVGIFLGNDFVEGGTFAFREEASTPSGIFRVDWDRSHLIRLVKERVAGSSVLLNFLFKMGGLLGQDFYYSPEGYLFLRNPLKKQSAFFNRILEEILKIRNLCRANQRELILVIFPTKIQVESRDARNHPIYDLEKPNREILAFCEHHDLKCLDLLPLLRQTYRAGGTGLYFPEDRHFNTEGARGAGGAIFDFLGPDPAVIVREAGGPTKPSGTLRSPPLASRGPR